MDSNILVCLPTYNEEENIEYMISRIRSLDLDLIVCDGHSTDETIKIAHKMNAEVLYRKGFGKGAAILKAMDYALDNDFDVVVTIDCDRTYHTEDIPNLLHYMEEFDMVVGARKMRDIAFLRRMANYVMTFTLNLFFGSQVKDMASGLRAIRTEKFKPFLDARSFDIEPQIYAVALREGISWREVPVSYSKRVGNSKIRLRHLFLILFRIIRERYK